MNASQPTAPQATAAVELDLMAYVNALINARWILPSILLCIGFSPIFTFVGFIGSNWLSRTSAIT